MAIDNDGYLWGKGSLIGINGTQTVNYTEMTKLAGDDSITDSESIKFLNSKFSKIILAYGSYMAIDENGNLWTGGSNWNYELGDGTKNASGPKIIAGPDSTGQYKAKITDFDVGTYDGIAVDENGDMYVWGLNAKTVIGKNEFGKVSITENDNSVKFKYIAVDYGGPFAAISTDGYVYYCSSSSSTFNKIDGLRLW